MGGGDGGTDAGTDAGTGCMAATTCNGHGTCMNGGGCECDFGFTGASCSECARDFYAYPICRNCSANTTCNGHGTCSTTGACTCATGFTDAGCDECAPGFVGYPACAPPIVQALGNDFTHFGPDAPDPFFLSDGGVLVAHTLSSARVVVSQLVGNQWQQIGPDVLDGGSNGTAIRPALVTTPTGPLVAFGEGTLARARRFDGTDWQPLDFHNGLLLNGGRSMDLILDTQGRPVVVFVDATVAAVNVKRLENGAWTSVGLPLTQLDARELRAAYRPNGTLVVFFSRSIPPFGTGVTAYEQDTSGAWSPLGGTVDAIGDTSQSISVSDLDVTDTITYASWNKGTCTALGRFIGSPTAWTNFGENGAFGANVQTVISGSGVLQTSLPSCVSATRSAQRWTGTTWNAPLTLPVNMNNADMQTFGGEVYLGYHFANAFSGNVAKLNVP